MAMASYTYSRLRGNYTGLTTTDVATAAAVATRPTTAVR